MPRLLALVSGGVVAGLILSEIETRLIWPQPVPDSGGLYVYERGDLGYRLKPNLVDEPFVRPEFDTLVSTNADGLRGDEVGLRGPDTFRILVLGDSFTFGYGANQEDAYPQVVEQVLGDLDTGWNYEVLNGGVPGYMVSQARAYYERYGVALQPDLVVVTVTINDVDLAAKDVTPFAVDASGHLVTPTRQAIGVRDGILGVRWPDPFDVGVFLHLNSHLYRLAARYVSALQVDVVQVRDLPAGPYIAADKVAGNDAVIRDLERISSLAEAGDAEMAVVLLPGKYEVTHRCGENAQYMTWFTQIIEWGDQTEGAVFDMLPLFCEQLHPGDLFYRVDGHLTPQGYRLTGNLVAGFLVQEGLVPTGHLDHD